jgi:GntR family transcriptional regulator, transcriptional repressor for pyruvate dehydrogenase complex
MDLRPIKKTSTTTKVFEMLHEMIATGQFRRGDKLPPQNELARQLGVSRNTLREAVNKLSTMGFVVSRQGVGTVVESPSPDGYLTGLSGQFLLDPLSVREFIEARICIERATVRLAVKRARPKDFSQIRDILEEQQKALHRADGADFTLHDTAFHLKLAKMSGNRVLHKFLETVQDMLHRFIGEVSQLPGAIEDAFAFHTRVSEAIAAKDADMAEKLIAQHLFSVVRHIESNLKVDLQQSTLSGYNLLQTDNDARKTKLK